MIKYFFKRFFLISFLPALILCSCKKEYVDSTSLPVVQAYLMPGNVPTVKVYAQKSLTDTARYGAPISGLKLYVSDGSQRVTLTETARGTYTCWDSSFLETGKTYTLSFIYQSLTVSAKTIMPNKPEAFATQYTTVNYTDPGTPDAIPDTIDRFTWDNPDSLNHVLVFNNLDGTAFPLSSFQNSTANFELNTNRASVCYVTPRTFPYYGHYQVVLLRVNQEYIDLLKSNASGANSQNLLNTPTNIVNGYGIFTAMQADTVNFNLL